MAVRTHQTSTSQLWLAGCFIIHITLLIVTVSSNGVNGETEWDNNCGICTCKWISGKKTANCNNKSLTVIPTEVSSDLQVIDLSNNQIAELRHSEFLDASLGNLHKIYLKNCTIQEINRDAFAGLLVLIELDLSNNQLKVLHPGTFKGVDKLRTILLNNNELERLDDYLFDNLPFLNKLEVRANRLHHVGLHLFSGGTIKVKNIDFTQNQLSVLKEETFIELTSLKSLSLNDNPWNCTCNLQQFQKYAINNKLYTPPTSCVEPPHLRDKLWSEISSDNFACKPRIVHPRTNTLIEAGGDNVTLTCRISGSPKPDIEWIFNKRAITYDDQRILIRNSQEVNRREAADLYTSELMIKNIKSMDKGDYICSATNLGGKAEVVFHVTLPAKPVERIGTGGGVVHTSSTNMLLIVCIVVIVLLAILIVVGIVLCCYCRRIKKYSKNGSISENGLVSGKMDKSHPANESILEGSVIMEMQKSLLTEVNPVEKPPRRAELDGSGDMTDDAHELKKTLLDETMFGHPDDETQSISLSDTTARSRTTYIDDGYGTNLPPDLLAFPSRFPQSPSLQSSISNIPDHHLYATKSPVASPIYQHHPAMYQGPNAGYRTLQLPKQRNMAAALHQRSQSPFTPAPIIYPAVVMKQGYVTIPRKPRTPSWTPSLGSTMTADYPLASTNGTMGHCEPVYDNLGVRTTASGHLAMDPNKMAGAAAAAAIAAAEHNFSMKDRPLPATPLAYQPIPEAMPSKQQQQQQMKQPPQQQQIPAHLQAGPNNESTQSMNNYSNGYDDTEALYGSRQPIATISSTNGGVKVPPRPPPKPKKKISTASAGGTPNTTGQADSTAASSQTFEDECEDGTEV